MKIPNWLKTVVSVLVLLLVLSIPFFVRKPVEKNDIALPIFSHSLSLGSQSFDVAIADTEILREQGLSFTESLGEQEGMLFVFETPEVQSFWMKDMNYPLDIIWIDSTKHIVGFNENVSPDSYPQTFSSAIPILYALEVHSGTVKKLGLESGMSVSF